MKPIAGHFSSVASDYAAFRPHYPDALFDFLAQAAPARDAAWDAGTGSGQAAIGLARHFGYVIATDASEAQLEHAPRHRSVQYRVARAEASEIPDSTMDLVTAAQAVHWFDLPAFWAEARRTLRSRGAVAIWAYSTFELDATIDPIVRRFYGGVVGQFWPPERRLVEQRYRTIAFPFDEFAAPDFLIERSSTLEELCGYVRTWSATRAYIEQRGEDPVGKLVNDLARVWGPRGQRRVVRWPIAMRIGRV
jgi:ubiquinone/menaquinone biosynthesis C-methylase UbiE